MVKTFSDIFTEDVGKFCDTLSPIKKPNSDELFDVHEDDDERVIPDVSQEAEQKEDITLDNTDVQAQLNGLSDDDINRIAQAVLKIQEEKKGE